MALAQLIPFSEFICSENERSTVHHNSFAEEKEFPVIDFTAANLIQELSNAARSYGFFQLINHGVDLDKIRQMQSQAKQLFNLPMEQKLLILHPEGSRLGYGFGGYDRRFWHEGFQAPDSSAVIQDLSSKLYCSSSSPASAYELSETIEKYTESMRDLGYELMKHLSTALDLQPDAFSKHCSREHMTLRINYYPACPDPSLTLGMPPHFDKHVLTLLHQDTVGGLQILRDNQWLGLKPRTDALIVNVGNALQVMSNGAYVSMKHRVVTNSNEARLSLAYLMSPRPNTVLDPPSELVDADHPPKYRRFTFQEMVKAIDDIRTQTAEDQAKVILSQT